MTVKVSLPDLVSAKCHFGHDTVRWHPKIKPFLHGEVGGIHVFDLDQTVEKLISALEFLGEQAQNGKRMLIVSTKP